jgi:hypothetical protein
MTKKGFFALCKAYFSSNDDFVGLATNATFKALCPTLDLRAQSESAPGDE